MVSLLNRSLFFLGNPAGAKIVKSDMRGVSDFQN